MRSTKVAQYLAPVRQAGIGDGAHQHPMIRRCNRQHPGDKHFGMVGIGAEDPGDEAEVGARALGVLERLQIAERAHNDRQPVRLRPAAIGVDPFEHGVGRSERRGGPRRGAGGRSEDDGQRKDGECSGGGAGPRPAKQAFCNHVSLQRRKPAARDITRVPLGSRTELNRPRGRFAGRSGAKSGLRCGDPGGAGSFPASSVNGHRLRASGLTSCRSAYKLQISKNGTQGIERRAPCGLLLLHR